MNAPTGMIKRGRKFDQVLDGAREVFLRDGYEGASVDQIARTAGVSKATLYSYFPDKSILFMEVAKVECRRQAFAATAEIETTAPARVVLTRAATHMLEFFLTDFGQQVFRIVVAESARFPELGREFYETVDTSVRDTIIKYFREAIGRGELKIDDLELAAEQFHELCKAWLFPRIVFGVQTSFSEAEIQRVIDGAVETFLARYGA